ncbi:MAG: MalT-like region, partial [Pseudomonadota bacterium]
EHIFPPQVALRQLPQILIPAVATIATTYDYELWRRGPRLTPLHAVAPQLEVVSLLWQGLGERMAGRLEAAVESYERVELLLARADRSGVDPSHALYARLGIAWGVGMLQAMMGQDQCLAPAELLSRDPWYRVSGVLVRMLHGYWQADPAQGDAEKERGLLSLIESKSRYWFEGVHLVAELAAHALADDLERVKGVLPDLRSLAELASGWQPIYDCALGEYHRLRGDLPGALRCFEQARRGRPGTEHQIWALAASGELRVLNLQERFTAAISAGEEYLKLAVQGGLMHLAQYVRIPLARAYAGGGELPRATSLIDEVLVDFERRRVTGLTLGWAHEARSQIALTAGDAALAQQSLEACSRQFRAAENALGRRRCEQLAQALEELSREQQSEQRARDLEHFQATVSTCPTQRERATAALTLLLEQTGATAGILKLVGALGGDTVELGLGAERERAEQVLEDLLRGISKGDVAAGERAADDAAAADVATVTALVELPQARPGPFLPVILRHGGERPGVSGVVLLLAPAKGMLGEPSALAAALSRALSSGSEQRASSWPAA